MQINASAALLQLKCSKAKALICHVPHNWTDKIARKMQASKEVWGKIFGTIKTPEKFVDHRLELAAHEWARFKANDPLECRNCHSADSMDINKQSPRASVAHHTICPTCVACRGGSKARRPRIFTGPLQNHAEPRHFSITFVAIDRFFPSPISLCLNDPAA